jgi:hypothetical protein
MILNNNYIGLSGWAKSGKDTVANYLVENYGYKKLSFAEPMRESLLRLNPLVPYMQSEIRLATAVRHMGWEDLKRINPEVRELLQRFGTEVGREMFGQNFWVDLAISKIQPGDKVVFADVRYKNEADAIRNLGGPVVRVARDGVGPANNHSSEHDLNTYDFDLVVANNGSLDDLWTFIDSHFG